MESKPKRILLADDEPDILEIISYNLTQQGYEVYTAKNGEEALDKAKLLNPDLIILDIMMPKKTGIEVCKILRTQSIFKNTLIIFLTALDDEPTHIKGLETGADDYISKPISPKITSLFWKPINEIKKSANINPDKFTQTFLMWLKEEM